MNNAATPRIAKNGWGSAQPGPFRQPWEIQEVADNRGSLFSAAALPWGVNARSQCCGVVSWRELRALQPPRPIAAFSAANLSDPGLLDASAARILRAEELAGCLQVASRLPPEAKTVQLPARSGSAVIPNGRPVPVGTVFWRDCVPVWVGTDCWRDFVPVPVGTVSWRDCVPVQSVSGNPQKVDHKVPGCFCCNVRG